MPERSRYLLLTGDFSANEKPQKVLPTQGPQAPEWDVTRFEEPDSCTV